MESVDERDFTVEVLLRPGPIDERRSESAQVRKFREWEVSLLAKRG